MKLRDVGLYLLFAVAGWFTAEIVSVEGAGVLGMVGGVLACGLFLRYERKMKMILEQMKLHPERVIFSIVDMILLLLVLAVLVILYRQLTIR